MRASVAAAWSAMILLASTTAAAHRLDEYLQATTITLEKARVQVEIRLAPGIAVFPIVFADIDRDADGIVSGAEQRAYAERVLGDLSLSVDGKRLPLHLISSTFPQRETLQQGLGEIRFQLESDLPEGAATRRLAFENRHQTRIGAYLVNTLVPGDPDLRITAQNRNFNQSLYALDYTDAAAPVPVLASLSLANAWGLLGTTVLGLIAGIVLFSRRKSTTL